MSAPVDFALKYAALGWPILPVTPGGKNPLGGNGISHATTDPTTIRAWFSRCPDANIGISLAPAGLAAIDIDPRNGGSADHLPEKLDTLTASSGGGGLHLLVRVPESAELPGKFGTGIDVKWRGYILIEPSIHPSGGAYSWLDWDVLTEPLPAIAEAPRWLLAPAKKNGSLSSEFVAQRDSTPSGLPGWLRELIERGAPEGERSEAFFKAVRKLAELGHGAAAIERILSAHPTGIADKYAGRLGDEITRALRKEDTRTQQTPQGGSAQAGREQEAATPEPQPLRLVHVSLDGVMEATPPPRQFVIEPLVPRRVTTLLGGHGGAGKSTLGLILCAHVATGTPWGGFEVARGKAVFISLEDEAALLRYRLRRIIERYELAADEVLANVALFDGSDADAAFMREVNEFGIRHLTTTPTMGEFVEAIVGAGLIVVDNSSDAFDGDEINRRQVRAFMRLLTQTARKQDAGLVLLAHIDKDAARNGGRGNAYSGSTAWHNSARSRLALVADENGALSLIQEKLNLGKKAEPLALQFADYGVLVPGAQDTTGRQAAEALAAKADAAAVLAAIRLADEAGIIVPTATAGPWTACHALESLPEHLPMYRTRAGRHRVGAALVRLTRDRLIERVEYRKPTRKIGERWQVSELAHCAPNGGA